MEAFVIGHWATDGTFHSDHINGVHHNVFPYKDKSDLKRQIIQLFTYDGQTVVDADPKNGEQSILMCEALSGNEQESA